MGGGGGREFEGDISPEFASCGERERGSRLAIFFNISCAPVFRCSHTPTFKNYLKQFVQN
jgi:hypothetical protein